MRRILYQIDSFTETKFEGNPAGVVINAQGLTENQMQSIARELNNSETAFLFPQGSNYDGAIRYFTPQKEVPICGHATIAAMYARAMEEDLDNCTLRYKTNIGILPFSLKKSGNGFKITMTQGKYESRKISNQNKGKILAALGLTELDLNQELPIEIASTGNSKVMVPLRRQDTLNQIQPNFEALIHISQEISCNGYFPFILNPLNKARLVEGRMFAPAIGIAEDPVTGNAHGPMGGYLIGNNIVTPESDRLEFTGHQGGVMGRPGKVDVSVKIANHQPALIQISGAAVTVFRTEIIL